jgi:hypothetical protein
MNYQKIEQLSPEWWALKVGKISGTRFGQLISTRENSLIDECLNELLDGYIEPDDYENEDLLFGRENEKAAIDLYEQISGITFAERGGVIISDYSSLSIASPDAVNLDLGIVCEAKCTMHGKTQIKRFRKGIESDKLPQIINYFAQSDDVKQVHWISYCPFRTERPLVSYIFTPDTIVDEKKKTTIAELVVSGRTKLVEFEQELEKLKNEFITIDF